MCLAAGLDAQERQGVDGRQRDHFNAVKQQRICSEAGLFDIGTDYDKIRRIRAEKNEACERLKT